MKNVCSFRLLLVAAICSCGSLMWVRRAEGAGVLWAVDAGGNWSAASNWSSNPLLPGVLDDVTISGPASNYLITLDSGVQSIHSLVTTEALTLSTGGTLSVSSTMQVNNTFTLSGGTLQNAVLSAGTGGQVVVKNGTLDGVTANVNMDLTSLGATATITNGLTLNGTATLGHAAVSFSGNQTLGGNGTVVFQNSGNYEAMVVSGDNTTLTIGPGITLRGGNGGGYNVFIGYAGDPYFGGSNASVINQGTINADTPGTGITISPTGSFTNTGSIQANNGGTLYVYNLTSSGGHTVVNNGNLYLGGNLTQAALGTFSRTGGTVTLFGTLTGNLALTAATGSWNLLGGSISNSTITTSGGANLVFTSSGGTLDGVTVNANLDLTAGGIQVSVLNGLALNGTATLGGDTSILFNGNQTLSGNGTVVFTDNAEQGLIVNTSNMTLIIGPGMSIRGGNASKDLFNGAVIGYSSAFHGGSNASIINQGTINADTVGTSIFINSTGTFTNSGTIEASNGGMLVLSNLTGNLNAVIVTGVGSSINLAGAGFVNNMGLTVPIGTALTLNGTWSNAGTFTGGGNITFAGGAVTINGLYNFTGTTTISGVTLTFATANPSAGLINGAGSLQINAGTTLVSDSVNVSGWQINGNQILRATNAPRHSSAVLSSAESFALSPTSVLDVTNHDLLLGNSNMATVEMEILNGLGLNGTTHSPAIVSSTAGADKYLVPVDAAVFGGVGGLFDGVSITQPNSVVVKYTYKGDVNLDGKVSTADYLVLNGNFGKTDPGLADIAAAYAMGDVNLDGKVSTADYLVLNGNFEKGVTVGSPLLGGVSAQPVPEAGSLGALAVGVVGLWGRRKRGKRLRAF